MLVFKDSLVSKVILVNLAVMEFLEVKGYLATLEWMDYQALMGSVVGKEFKGTVVNPVFMEPFLLLDHRLNVVILEHLDFLASPEDRVKLERLAIMVSQGSLVSLAKLDSASVERKEREEILG